MATATINVDGVPQQVQVPFGERGGPPVKKRHQAECDIRVFQGKHYD